MHITYSLKEAYLLLTAKDKEAITYIAATCRHTHAGAKDPIWLGMADTIPRLPS